MYLTIMFVVFLLIVTATGLPGSFVTVYQKLLSLDAEFLNSIAEVMEIGVTPCLKIGRRKYAV